MSGTTHTPGSLNQAAAHDTGLYDPNVHDNQIVALYETDAQARAAQSKLTSAGFPAAAMQVVSRDSSNTGTTSASGAADEGLWGSIKSLFVPRRGPHHLQHRRQPRPRHARRDAQHVHGSPAPDPDA